METRLYQSPYREDMTSHELKRAYYHTLHHVLIEAYKEATSGVVEVDSQVRHELYEVLKDAQASLRSHIQTLGLTADDLRPDSE